MSILIQKAEAAFVQAATPDGRYHLVVKADLVGHSELQDRLIKKISHSTSLRREVEVVKGANDVPQLRVHLSASEKEVSELIAAENANREALKQDDGVGLGRSYTDIAADAKLEPNVKMAEVPVVEEEGLVDGSAQNSGSGSTNPEDAI